MDSDDEEMRDASSSSSMEGGGFEGEEEQAAAAAGGVMTLEVTWFQVDPDYEFDAPKWFDLAREEAPEAAAERWFASAPDYPPSRAYPSLSPPLQISPSRLRPPDNRDSFQPPCRV
jgi:hypothetical protein